MNAELQKSDFETKASTLRSRVHQLREKVEGLTNAATLDMVGKVDQINTMVSALERDANEILTDHGAEADTATQLYEVTNSKLTSLEHEIDALSLGNPTTVSAAIDAIMNLGSKRK